MAGPLLHAVLDDAGRERLAPADRALMDFVEKLTRTPDAMEAADVAALRAHGFGDDAVHDIVQIAALFNYYNRLADGLGIDPEP